MPFVHIVMEPRDEESKHRIGREVADAMAEGTNNSLDGISIIFHEVPRPGYARGLTLASRRLRGTAAPVRGDYVSLSRMKVGDEAGYLALRRDHLNPALARQDGFVSTTLLRLDGDGEYWLLNKWLSRAHADAWLASEEHAALAERAAAAPISATIVERQGGAFVHQQFGPAGGKVVEGVAAAATGAVAAAAGT